MNREVIIVVVVLGMGVGLFGCSSPETAQCEAQSEVDLTGDGPKAAGMPNPSAVYCKRLGYQYTTVADDEGNKSGYCSLPDGTVCGGWDFYRGKCGQEWSYCKLQGYDVKDVARWEGWVGGCACVIRFVSLRSDLRSCRVSSSVLEVDTYLDVADDVYVGDDVFVDDDLGALGRVLVCGGQVLRWRSG